MIAGELLCGALLFDRTLTEPIGESVTVPRLWTSVARIRTRLTRPSSEFREEPVPGLSVTFIRCRSLSITWNFWKDRVVAVVCLAGAAPGFPFGCAANFLSELAQKLCYFLAGAHNSQAILCLTVPFLVLDGWHDSSSLKTGLSMHPIALRVESDCVNLKSLGKVE